MHETIGAYNEQVRNRVRVLCIVAVSTPSLDLGFIICKQRRRKSWQAVCSWRGRVRNEWRVFRRHGGIAGVPRRRLKNPALFEVLANPFSLSDGFVGPDQPADNAIYEDDAIGQWVAPFIMAAINTKNIHRRTRWVMLMARISNMMK